MFAQVQLTEAVNGTNWVELGVTGLLIMMLIGVLKWTGKTLSDTIKDNNKVVAANSQVVAANQAAFDSWTRQSGKLTATLDEVIATRAECREDMKDKQEVLESARRCRDIVLRRLEQRPVERAEQ